MRVAIVVDRQFGERLVPLVAQGPVWICDTPANRLWIDRGRRGGDVTSFSVRDDDTPESLVLNVLSTVDLHHGEWGEDEPWSELEIVGVEPSPSLRAALAAYGVDRIERTPTGFVGVRVLHHAERLA